MADCQASDVRKRYSRPQEGEAPFGAQVLWFVRFAPNDGFCPQSGTGSEEDYKCRLRRQRCLWQRKPSQPGFARWKCTPFGAAHHLSPKGKHVTGFSGRSAPLRIQFLCHPGGGTLLAAQLLLSQAVQSIASLKSPPLGEMSPQARLFWFCRGAAYKTSSPRSGDTTTL